MPNKKQIKKVTDWIDKYTEILCLQQWEIHLVINDNEFKEETETSIKIAEIRITDNYLFATVFIEKEFFDQDEETQEIGILHELLHIYINPLYQSVIGCLEGKLTTTEKAKSMNEQTTSVLSRIIYSLVCKQKKKAMR